MSVTAEVTEDGRIHVSSDWRHKELLKGIPGAKWRQNLGPQGSWTLPLSWSSCLALRSTFGSELTLGPNLFKWAQEEKKFRIDPCMYLRTQVDYQGDPKLFGWQRSGLEFVLYGKQVIIADDPGAGKTATTIRGLARLQQVWEAEEAAYGAGQPAPEGSARLGEPVFPILVVCPNSMKRTWKREFEAWWPGLKVNVVSGSATQRRKLLEDPAHVYVINFEGVKSHSRLAPYGNTALKRCEACGGQDPKVKATSCQVHEKELNLIDFRAVVVDEAHRAKSAKSLQTRAIKAAAGNAKVRLALTGTPTANDVTDLWSILNFLAPEEFASKTKWIDRFIETMLDAWGGLVVIGIKPQHKAEFDAILDSRMRRMQEDVVLRHLPPITYEQRDVEMSAKQKKAYKDMKSEMNAELDGGTLQTDSPMIKAMRLLQIASSYGVVETTEVVDQHGFPKLKQQVTLAEPSSKLDAFMDDLDDFGKDQVAVMAVSRQLIELLSARLEKRKIPHGLVTGNTTEDERQQAMDDFQSKKIQFILFTTGAGGTGITLTAARYLCRLQLPFSFVDYKQSLRRVRRLGSEKYNDNIIVIDYVTEGTIEPNVFDALHKKGQSFEEVVRDAEAFRKMLGDDK